MTNRDANMTTCHTTLDGEHHFDYRQIGNPYEGLSRLVLQCKCGKRPGGIVEQKQVEAELADYRNSIEAQNLAAQRLVNELHKDEAQKRLVL